MLGVYYILYSGNDGNRWRGGFAFGSNPFATLQKFPKDPILMEGLVLGMKVVSCILL